MKKLLILSLGALVFTVFNSCNKKEGCMDPAALNFNPDAEVDKGCLYTESYATEMHMHQYINGGELVAGNTYTINGTQVALDLVQFYVGNITLIDADGNETVAEDVYLLVKPDEEAYAIGNIPAGNYTAIRFDVGIDSATNHADPSQYALGDPLGAQSPSMHWGWSFGYIFIRIDGQADSDADGTPDPAGAFEMHAGEDHYLATIELPISLTIGDGQENIIHMEADWDTFFTGVDMVNDNTMHGSDNEPLANLLLDNTLNMFSTED